LRACEQSAKIIVIAGSREVFCFGADFRELERGYSGSGQPTGQDPRALYELWSRLALGPFLTIAHVRGKANAGGVGFVAACDVVVSDESAVFSLSELLFGLMPACVMPFLIRRMGFAKANYMALLTQPASARQAEAWGLVDVCGPDSENLLRKQLLRVRRLGKAAIANYKSYLAELDQTIGVSGPKAVQANMRVFADPRNIERITRFVKTGQFPWE
jgi:polyketide biosynthesis enoyl-CoA hydratase PksH